MLTAKGVEQGGTGIYMEMLVLLVFLSCDTLDASTHVIYSAIRIVVSAISA